MNFIKQVEGELVGLAHEVLRLKGNEDVPRLQNAARKLYEQLSILLFVTRHLEANPMKEAEKEKFIKAVEQAFDSKNQDEHLKHQLEEHNHPDYPRDAIITPGINTIKDLVAEMPAKSESLEDLLTEVLPEPTFIKKEAAPISTQKNESSPLVKQLSLNDKLNNGIHIGLNDRLAFVNQLFGGSTADFNRVVSQLNTLGSSEEVISFLESQVKPDYGFWEGKEPYADRFLELVLKKYQN